MTDEEILFRAIKDIALKNPQRDEDFKKFVKGDDPTLTFHHVCGSLGSLKSTDYLGVGIGISEHTIAEGDRAQIIKYLPRAIGNLLRYVKHQKQQIAELKKQIQQNRG